MTDPMLFRLFWKEYRVQRGFWLSLGGLTLGLQLIIAAIPARYLDHTTWMFNLAVVFPAFYALGCGATTFALEREEGTAEQLRILAVPAGRLFLTKLVFGLVSALALLGVLSLLAFALARGQLPTGGSTGELWGFWGFALLEMLAWGLFFSLLTRRPLTAACLAAAAWLAALYASNWIGDVLLHYSRRSRAELWLLSTPCRILFAAAVLGLDGWLCLRWISPRRFWTRARLRLDQAARPSRALWPGGIGRVIWQEWRQARPTMAILSGIALGLLLLNRFFASPRVDMVAGFWWLSWLIAFALPPLMGACVFLAEQEGQRFRFFAARGIPARQVWLGKHLVWLPMTELAGTIACGVTIATWAFLQSMPMGQVWANWPLAFFGLLWPFVGYSAGQFVSMLIPRGLLAGVVALVLAACVASWKALMGWLGVNLFLSVAPIPVVLMLITWLRAPEWMLERHKLGSWLRIAGVLTASAAALIGVVAAYRMYEIPAREPGFSPDEFLRAVTANEAETADLYREATSALKPMRKAVEPDGTQQEMTSALEGWDKATGAERDWLEANRESVEITLRATQHAACVFHDPREMTLQTVLNDVQATRDLGRLLVLDARRLESEGELDAALEHYLATLRMAQHVAARGSQMQLFVGIALEALVDDMMPRWAAHREQTPERIRHAIGKIQGLAEHAPGRSDAAVVEYLILRRLLLGDWSLLASVSDDQIAQIILWIMDRWMPWERQRSLRLLDVLIAEDLARSDSFQKALAAGQAVPYSRLSSWGIGPQGENGKWLQTTVVLRLHYPALAYSAEAITRSVTRQRALLLILALKGWQIEHGELPSSLDDLVGSYFSGLPTDPYSGGQFGYLPRGFEGPVEAGSRNQIGLPSEAIIEPGQPVIWSTLGLYGGLTRSGRGDDKGRPLLFLNGWPFVIP